MTNIGKPIRQYEVDPLELPAPLRKKEATPDTKEPDKEPVKTPEKEPEKVPA